LPNKSTVFTNLILHAHNTFLFSIDFKTKTLATTNNNKQQQQTTTTKTITVTTMTAPKLKTTIAILGCGDVGSTLAYTLVLQPICSEVVLIDLKASLLEAQVRDLRDATYHGNSGVKVRAGTHKDAGQADIVVITAGAKQKIGESRLSLLSRNLHILESIFGAMAPISPHTILLLVANPVDILTYFAQKMSGLPEAQVLGTGTSLDSARLRGILADKAEVAPNSIDAYVLGEHGDSQFVRIFLFYLLLGLFWRECWGG
jgi:L-lactate dehydrogenase